MTRDAQPRTDTRQDVCIQGSAEGILRFSSRRQRPAIKEFLLAACLAAASASGTCAELRAPEGKPERPPAEQDRLPPSPPQEGMSSGSGMVIEPPVTDTEALKKPPENIDPEIGRATDDIDDKNRKELQKKAPVR